MTKRATRGKKKGANTRGIAPFDAFVAVSLLAVFFVLILHTEGQDRYAPDTPAAVTVSIKDLSPEECRRLSGADALFFDGVALTPEGEIAFANSSRVSYSRDAEALILYSPERYDATLTLRVMGADTEDGYFLCGSYFLARGAPLPLSAEGLTVKTTVMQLTRLSEGASAVPRPLRGFSRKFLKKY